MNHQNWLGMSKLVLGPLALATALGASSSCAFADVYEGPSGGSGGSSFWDSAPTSVRTIYVRHGSLVDAVQTVWSNGQVSSRHGGGGGSLDWFTLPVSQNLNYVWGYSGSYVDSIGFCSNGRICSPRWGGNGGAFFSYQAPAGTSIVGFKGRSGSLLDAVGVIIR